MSLVDDFCAAHARIETGLVGAEAVASDPTTLLVRLKELRPEVVKHFQEKDAFYPALSAQCTRAGDTAASQLTKIFESNMKVQSAAVQRFFQGLEASTPAVIASSFRTVTLVIRQRFGTEERAIFPIYQRTWKPEAA